jgi:hypothetical protein
VSAGPAGPDAVLEAALNLSRFHREHERFYAASPLERAVRLHRHARALLALADRWTTVEPSTHPAPSPYAGAEDLNSEAATALDGVLFLEGEGRPAELTAMIAELRADAEGFASGGDWLAKAMQASWNVAATLLEVDGLAHTRWADVVSDTLARDRSPPAPTSWCCADCADSAGGRVGDTHPSGRALRQHDDGLPTGMDPGKSRQLVRGDASGQAALDGEVPAVGDGPSAGLDVEPPLMDGVRGAVFRFPGRQEGAGPRDDRAAQRHVPSVVVAHRVCVGSRALDQRSSALGRGF